MGNLLSRDLSLNDPPNIVLIMDLHSKASPRGLGQRGGGSFFTTITSPYRDEGDKSRSSSFSFLPSAQSNRVVSWRGLQHAMDPKRRGLFLLGTTPFWVGQLKVGMAGAG